MSNNLRDVLYYQYLFLKPYENDQKKIKINYNKLVKLFHPDKTNQNVSTFHRINNAYQILSNPALKFIYDSLGKEAVKVIEVNQKAQNKINSILSSSNNPLNQILLDKFKKYLIENIRSKQNNNKPFNSYEISHFLLENRTNYLINNVCTNNFSFGLLFQDLGFYKNQIHKFSNYNFNFNYMRIEGTLKFNDLHSLYSNNNLYFTYFNWTIIPTIIYNKNKFSLRNCKCGYNYKNKACFIYDYIDSTLNISGTIYKDEVKKRKLDYNVTVSSYFNELILVQTNDNKKFQSKYGFVLSNKNIALINEVQSKTSHPNVGLNSKMSLLKNFFNENSLNLKVSFKDNVFIQFPLIIYKRLDIFSFLILLLPSFYQFFLSKFAKKSLYSLYDEINKNNQNMYNSNHKDEYNYILQNKTKELLVIYAIIGKYSKIKEIITKNKYYGEYSKVFDIKIPLMLNVYNNNKLIIPLDIFDIEGIYLPEHEYKKEIAYFIKYEYKGSTYTYFGQNNKDNVEINLS